MQRAELPVRPNRVAIVGVAFRFPGAQGEGFWNALREGRNLVSEVDPSRWSRELYLHPRKSEPGTAYTSAGGTLGDVSGFDAAFFGISPREAAQLDPQQRLLLELSWEAFEAAGIPPSSVRGSRASVHIGFSGSDYAQRGMDDLAAVSSYSMTGITGSIAANRLSYVYDLRGPSMSVDTACSSSLVAVHAACQGLLSGDVEMAVAGAVNLHLHPFAYVAFSKAAMLSPRGICSPFDASADGYVRSEGGAIVLMKRLEDAVASGDRIYGVIAGSCVNCDGKTNGLTVPSWEAQAALLSEVYSRACIDPAEIDYLEAHGTGTPVGDPIEARALAEALGKRRREPLAIGSVKSNVGHLETASGMAGLVKALYCLRHRSVPPSINFNKANPHIPFQDWNLEVVAEGRELDPTKRLVIGINSFGFGGANAHVVLESHAEPAQLHARDGERAAPFIVTARSEEALRATALRSADWLDARSDLAYYDIAYSAAFHRDWLEHRAFAFGHDRADVARALREFARDGSHAGVSGGRAVPGAHGPAFVYSGNGSQWAGMGQRLLAESDVFARAVREVADHWSRHSSFALVDSFTRADVAELLESTEHAQPMLFALQVGLTEMLADWGVTPVAVAGHSVGEIAAAWACGALSLEQAVDVVYWRSALQAKTRGAGAMSAVALGEREMRALLSSAPGGERICIAAANSPRGVTLAGPGADLELLEASLAARGVGFRRLALDYGFHSSAMDPIEQELKQTLGRLRPRRESIPFYSTVTGKAISGHLLDADYWWRNIRACVQFRRAVQRLKHSGVSVFVEVGPNPALRSYVSETLRQSPGECRVLPTMTRSGDGFDALRDKACQVLAAGCATDLSRLFPEKGRRVDLPPYPWQREKHWNAPTAEGGNLINRRRVHPLLGYRIGSVEGEWESQIDPQVVPALADHCVGGQIVVPAAAFAEMALAAARDSLAVAETCEIEELEIRSPLVLDDDRSKTVRFALDAERRFSIRSRERLSSDPWRVHVVGKLSSGAQRELCAPREPARLPAAELTQPGAQHYALTASVGLDYGPAFQQVTEYWRDGAAVCAKLGGTAGDGQLAVARALDGAFQLLVHLLKDERPLEAGVAFVPVKIERLVWHGGEDRVHAARLELVRRSPRSVLAHCTLHDEQGMLVAEARGVRFRAVQLRKPTAALTFLECVPYLRGGAAAPLERMAEVCRSRLHERTRLQARERYFNDIEPLLEATLAAFAKEALAGAQGVEPVGALQKCLHEIAGDEDYPPGGEIWSQLFGDHPDQAQEVIWLGRFGLHLSQLLRGVPWPGGRLLPAAHFGPAIADAVGEAMRALAPQRRLRAVALDAGHSPSLARILEKLDLQRCDCVVLCADPALLEERKALAARYRGTVVRSIDLDADEPALPAEAREPFDLLIVEDGLDWNASAERVLATLQRLAADQAVLLLAAQQPSRAALLANRIVAAAQRGAAAVVTVPPARDPSQWRSLLSDYGFTGLIAVADTPELESGSQLLLAAASPRAPHERAAQRSRFAILTEERGPGAEIAARLAAQLAERQQHAVLIHDIGQLHEADALVDLAGYGAPLEQQAARCARLAQQLERLATMPKPPALWIVTGASHRAPDEAPVWGFARTAINEYRSLAVRVADLAEPEAGDAMARVLADALLDPGADDEQIITSSGRLVTRIETVTPAADAPAPAEAVRLEVPPGGQLKHLSWTAQALPAPREGEVEIEVRAAGLNFRDVMFAMGHLSDEALENGFSGPSLGMEVSGVVLRAGGGVHGVRKGDEVIAFAPAGLGTRVVTSANAVVKKPAGWSFEAATTIPATFLTAYYALHYLARLEEGQKVLIHGAAGGVGLAAIQLAQMAGAEIFATAGSDAKRDVLRLLGIEHVLDSRSLAFADEIRLRTRGAGVDVVLNSLAGEAMARSLQALKPFGRFLELGKRDFYENTRVGLRPFRNNISYFAIDADQLMLERPELTRRLMQELMQLFKNGRLKPLPYRAFAVGDAAEAFRYMQQSKHIGKIVLGFDAAPQPPRRAKAPARRLELRADATYLVTGGLRGFGLRTAQWLADHGARHLVLVGRSGAGADAEPALAELRARGVEVKAASCDVSDRAALEKLLAQVQATMAPLRGVIHAAAVISDAMIRSSTVEQIEAVFAPKVLGARHLHELTRERELDFFVLYSSATTLFGNPGQASYVAANRYLEVLAQQRRAAGLPALCVSWGPIADAGYLARHAQIRDALEARMGGSALGADEALALLGELLAGGASRSVVLRFDRGGPARMLAGAASPKFQPLLARFEQVESAGTDAESLQRWLDELNDEELEVVFTDIVKKEIGEILRMSPDKLDVQRPLPDLGLDSLMGVELMTAIEARFGVNIPVMAMSDIGSIERLVKRIVAELRRGRTAQAQEASDGVQAQVRRIAAQHGDGEIDAAQADAIAAELKDGADFKDTTDFKVMAK